MIKNDWDGLLKDEFEKTYFKELVRQVKSEYHSFECYPPIDHVFDALRLSSFASTKVVILGQDPYHNEGEAMGLCFSVRPGIAKPPSLQNIFKELQSDLGFPEPVSGDLTRWAKQGVLLLNAIMSVRKGNPLSHEKLGWLTFTDKILALLNAKTTPVVFILWGSFARSKKSLITNPIHHVIENVHPSPLSVFRGFFGSRPFSETNRYLISSGISPIDFDLSGKEH